MKLGLLPKDEWKISFEGDVLILTIEVWSDNYLHHRAYKLHEIGSGNDLPSLVNLKGVEFDFKASDG